MAAITTRRIDLPTATGADQPLWLDCREAGSAGAPLLVFLHGFPEAAFVWDRLMTRFAGRYHCVAPNLRGYAGSAAPAAVSAYRAEHLVGDVAGLIAALGGRAHAVIAHDWGGAVAWALAMQRPQLLQRLVILNSPHPGVFLTALQQDAAQQAASAYMNMLRRPDAAQKLAADDFALLWQLFTQFGGAPWLTDAQRAAYRQAWSAGLEGPLNYYRASPLHPPTGPDDAVHTLRLPDAALQVRVPTDVVWGEADTALPPALLDGLDRYVADLRIERLPGASHWLVHEQPEAVAAAIERALARGDDGPAA